MLYVLHKFIHNNFDVDEMQLRTKSLKFIFFSLKKVIFIDVDECNKLFVPD